VINLGLSLLRRPISVARVSAVAVDTAPINPSKKTPKEEKPPATANKVATTPFATIFGHALAPPFSWAKPFLLLISYLYLVN